MDYRSGLDAWGCFDGGVGSRKVSPDNAMLNQLAAAKAAGRLVNFYEVQGVVAQIYCLSGGIRWPTQKRQSSADHRASAAPPASEADARLAGAAAAIWNNNQAVNALWSIKRGQELVGRHRRRRLGEALHGVSHSGGRTNGPGGTRLSDPAYHQLPH
jgi:hypothetical protein